MNFFDIGIDFRRWEIPNSFQEIWMIKKNHFHSSKWYFGPSFFGPWFNAINQASQTTLFKFKRLLAFWSLSCVNFLNLHFFHKFIQKKKIRILHSLHFLFLISCVVRFLISVSANLFLINAITGSGSGWLGTSGTSCAPKNPLLQILQGKIRN